MHLHDIQNRTVEVGTEVFGEAGMISRQERLYRLAEEMLELLRTAGLTYNQLSTMAAHEYFDRKPGELSQEVAGVQCTLLSFADAHGIETEAVTLIELQRVLDKKDLCRAKHAAKPMFARAV
jgi:hypothetical protein